MPGPSAVPRWTLDSLIQPGVTDTGFFASIAEALASTFRAESVDVLTTVPGGLMVRASTAHPQLVDALRLGKGVGLAGHALATETPIFIERGLAADPRYVRYSGLDEPEYEAAAAVAIPGDEGPLGAVLLRWRDGRRFPAAWKRELARAMDQLAVALPVFRAAYESGVQTNSLRLLAEVTDTLAGSPYLEETLQQLVHLTAQRFNYQSVTVRILDERRQELILRATLAAHRAYPRKPAIRLGESIAGRALTERRTIIVPDVQHEPDYVSHDLAQEQGLRSMICIPLTVHQRGIGVLSCYTGEVRQFPPEEVSTLEALARHAAVSIENARLHARSTLMQEMHHRVKNNLQQVASLLRLQLRQSDYKSLEEGLSDTLGRILAIASVHELLSREDLDHVPLRSIAEMLVGHQQQSFLSPGKRIDFSVRGDDVTLNHVQATQVALILNELLQNAVTHGFHVSDEGEIHVTVEDRDGQIGLWVSDDGDPLPAGFDLRQGQLGLQIIRSLTQALGGRVTIEDRLGWTVAEVRFARAAAE